jgi:predicted ATPase
MIKSIRLQNFFGFQDCTINLEKGENVLVGINGSGKSNFFKAIRLLQEGNNGILKNLLLKDWGGLQKVGFIERQNNSIKQTDNKITVSTEFDFENNGLQKKRFEATPINNLLTYILSIDPLSAFNYNVFEKVIANTEISKRTLLENKKGTVKFFNIETNQFSETKLFTPDELALGESAFGLADVAFIHFFCGEILNYSLFDTSKNSKIRSAVQPTADEHLEEDGANLTQLLHSLNLNDKTSFKQIVASLKKVNEKFDNIDFNLFSNNIELLLEEHEMNRSLPASNISDGTLRFLCLMAILYNPNRGNVICIDEPELGLHPDMINTLAEAIHYAAETSQIVISTHSPELLNHFNVENIRVFEKDENNATVVNQYEIEQFDTFMNKYMPGQLWRQGHLGGNRW